VIYFPHFIEEKEEQTVNRVLEIKLEDKRAPTVVFDYSYIFTHGRTSDEYRIYHSLIVLFDRFLRTYHLIGCFITLTGGRWTFEVAHI